MRTRPWLRASLFLLFAVSLSGAGPLKAEIQVQCSKGHYMLFLSETTVGTTRGLVSRPSYQVYKNYIRVGKGVLRLKSLVYDEEYFHGFVWTFYSRNGKSVVTLAVPGVKAPTPGLYRGTADISLYYGQRQKFEVFAAPCQVTIIR